MLDGYGKFLNKHKEEGTEDINFEENLATDR